MDPWVLLFFVPVMRDVLDLFHLDPLIQHLVSYRMIISFLRDGRCIGARCISRTLKVTQRRLDDLGMVRFLPRKFLDDVLSVVSWQGNATCGTSARSR